MGMSKNAQIELPMHMGMGSTWADMGNDCERANWTDILQASMCTRVAHVVSDASILPNIPIVSTWYGQDAGR